MKIGKSSPQEDEKGGGDALVGSRFRRSPPGGGNLLCRKDSPIA